MSLKKNQFKLISYLEWIEPQKKTVLGQWHAQGIFSGGGGEFDPKFPEKIQSEEEIWTCK